MVFCRLHNESTVNNLGKITLKKVGSQNCKFAEIFKWIKWDLTKCLLVIPRNAGLNEMWFFKYCKVILSRKMQSIFLWLLMIINVIDVLNVTEKGGINMDIFLSHLLTKFITNGAALSDFIPTYARSIKLSFANMAKWWTFFLTQKGIALFRPWRRGKDGCITTFKSLLIESEESKCFGKFKLNPCTYCSLLLYF